MQLIKPFKSEYPITQTFAEHIQRAKNNGWCYKPGTCPGGVYYLLFTYWKERVRNE